MTRIHPIRCRCGALQGEVDTSARATRAVCYCRDCRAYAYYLGPPEGMLDGLGGTEIVAVQPRYVHFSQGLEHLCCMSLSPTGTLRWYAACCRTPVANTPRDIRVSHAGLVHLALSADGVLRTQSFGPIQMHVHRQSARGQPPSNRPFTFFAAVVGYLAALGTARISGTYKINPFFNAATGAPRAEPLVLTAEQRAELMRVV